MIDFLVALSSMLYFYYFSSLSLKYTGNEALVYATNLILFFSTIIVAHIIIYRRSHYIHITSLIIILLWLGYVFKINYLLYLLEHKSSLETDYINSAYKLEVPLLSEAHIIDQYNEILIVTFLTSTGFLVFVTTLAGSAKTKILGTEIFSGQINRKKVARSLRLAKILFFIIAIAVINTGVAFTSGNIDYTVKLPFKIASAIQAVLNFILPSLFMLITYYAFQSRDGKLIRKTLFAYIIFCVVATLITTSKAYVYLGFFSLFVLAVYCYGLTRKIAAYLLIGVILITLVSNIASAFRIVRAIDPTISVFELPFKAAEYLSYFDSSANEKLQLSKIGILLRINGADSLLNVISWNSHRPTFSLVSYILYDQPTTINQYFATEVLGLPSQASLSFSPSLLGYIHILLNSHLFLSLFLILYFTFWLVVYRLLRLICSRDSVLILASLLGSAGFFTSEGTIETIYRAVFGLILISLFVRFSSRYYRR